MKRENNEQFSSMRLIPSLWSGTRDSLLHLEVIGRTSADERFIMEQREYSIPYMALYEDYENAADGTSENYCRPFYVVRTISGTGDFSIQGRQFTLEQNQAAWIDMNNGYRIRKADKCDVWEFEWLCFNGIGIYKYYKAFTASRQTPYIVLSPEERLHENINMLIEMYSDGFSSLAADMRADNILRDIALEFIGNGDMKGKLDHVPPVIAQIREYIDSNYAHHILLDDLGKVANLDKYYLQKTFKSCYGITPNTYLQEIRMKKAKHMLYTTDVPVSEIALQCGFDSTSYFISRFRISEGVTPAKYRMMLKSTPGNTDTLALYNDSL